MGELQIVKGLFASCFRLGSERWIHSNESAVLQIFDIGHYGFGSWTNKIKDIKLMRLEVMNRIVCDLDFKPADFNHWFWSNLDFNDEIKSTTAISIKFCTNFDYNQSILIFFDHFWLKDRKKLSYCRLFNRKWSISIYIKNI